MGHYYNLEGISPKSFCKYNEILEEWARCTFVYTNGILEESQGTFAHNLGTRLCQIRTIDSRKCFPASPQLVNISQSDDPISRYYQVAHEGEEGWGIKGIQKNNHRAVTGVSGPRKPFRPGSEASHRLPGKVISDPFLLPAEIPKLSHYESIWINPVICER